MKNFKEQLARMMMLLSVLKFGFPDQTCAEAWESVKVSSSNKGILPTDTSRPCRS